MSQPLYRRYGAHATDNTILTVFVLSALLCYLVPDLTSQTLSLDGLVYANIAQALVNSPPDTFWYLPFYEHTSLGFTDHPPLGMVILSTFMSLFGTDFWVEKLFGLLIICLSLFLVAQLVKSTRTEQNYGVWFVFLLLIVMPTFTYTTKNNYLETQLMLCYLGMVLLAQHSFKNSKFFRMGIGLGALTFAAFLIKGPVGLFGWLVPSVYFAAYGSNFGLRAWLTSSCTCILLSSTLFAATLGLDVQALSFWGSYWNNQVSASITGVRPAQHGRLYLLGQLFINLGWPLLITALITRSKPHITRHAVLYLLLGIGATLPLLISARTYSHYLLPSLPFFAMAIWSCFSNHLISNAARNILLVASIVLLISAIGLGVFSWGLPGDHAQDIEDAHRIAATVDQHPPAYCSDFVGELRLRAYMYRHHLVKTSSPNSGMASTSAHVLCFDQPTSAHLPVLALNTGAKLWHNSQLPKVRTLDNSFSTTIKDP